MEALALATSLIKTIFKLYDDKAASDSRIKDMVERAYSLDQPLQVLKKSCRNPAAYELIFKRLVDVLTQVEAFLGKMQAAGMNQAKKWSLAESHLKEMATMNRQLNDCLMDLQTAVQAEEAERSEARVMETALATVNALADAEKQKLLETIRVCVHCSQEYRESSNAEGSCKYHKARPVGNWSYKLSCCNKEHKNYDACFTDPEGCVRGKHRDKHHHDFPYSAYFRWMSKEAEKEAKVLLEVTQEDLEDEMDKAAYFGVRTDGDYFLKLKKGNFNLFLSTYSAEDLQKMSSNSDLVMVATRGSDKLPDEFDASTPEMKWFINAFWELKNSKICGVTLTVKSLTKAIPNSKTAFFNPASLPAISEVKVTHDDTVPLAQRPALPNYVAEPKVEQFTPFPKEVYEGWSVNDDHSTETTDGLKLRIKQSGKCEANPNTSGFSSDEFVVPFMLMHFGQASGQGSSQEERLLILQMVRDGKVSVDEGVKLISTCENTAHASQSYTIVGIKTEYQFEGETQWRRTEFDPELASDPLPIEVKPRSAVKMVVKARVKAPGKQGSWFNQAFVARLKPIRFKITLDEMGGAKASTCFEYANPPSSFKTRDPKDVFFLSLDSLSQWERLIFRITKEDNHLKIAAPNSYIEATPKNLRVWAHAAKKANVKEYKLENLTNSTFEASALVDHDLSIVYGFKFVIKTEGGELASDTYLLPPDQIQF